MRLHPSKKRCLNRLHYFGKYFHTAARDTGTKSRVRFQDRIDRGTLDLTRSLGYYEKRMAKIVHSHRRRRKKSL